MRACGIDPGTSRWGFYVFEDTKPILDRSINTSDWDEIQRQLEELCRLKLDVIAAPSGYGTPLKLLSEVSDLDRELMTLWSGEGRIGIKKSLELLKDIPCNIFVIPGVKHLPSVPKQRKINRIDLGTPDKVCAVAYSMVQLQREFKIPYQEMDFILAELGAGFNAFLRIFDGALVDGIGGSNASFGFRSGGRLDAELAYLLGQIRKTNVFEGGILSGVDHFTNFSQLKEESTILWKAFIESILKDIAYLDAIQPKTNLVILSGKMTKDPILIDHIESVIDEKSVVSFPTVFKAGHAAVGAAYLAEGLQGGQHRNLVESLAIQQSSGTSIDDILYQSSEKTSLLRHLREHSPRQ
ncbi:MAG: DUF1464 family protein [Candidatus Heimdallarchaeota archaeon]